LTRDLGQPVRAEDNNCSDHDYRNLLPAHSNEAHSYLPSLGESRHLQSQSDRDLAVTTAKEYSIQSLSSLGKRLLSPLLSERDSENDNDGHEPVKLIVGLGNPGGEYRETRHNVGFMVVDEIARRCVEGREKNRFRAQLLETRLNGQRVVLVKPQTYMNLSGVSVNQVVSWYRVDTADLLVVADDLDLPFGALRMRERGSAGGHNGLQSIIEELGTSNVPRLRLGIGRSARSTTSYVLSRFSDGERAELADVIERAADGVELWVASGPVAAMNSVNQRSHGEGRSSSEIPASSPRSEVDGP
jgi:peptidyl-tRNA hydrolase, PTH1 family